MKNRILLCPETLGKTRVLMLKIRHFCQILAFLRTHLNRKLKFDLEWKMRTFLPENFSSREILRNTCFALIKIANFAKSKPSHLINKWRAFFKRNIWLGWTTIMSRWLMTLFTMKKRILSAFLRIFLSWMTSLNSWNDLIEEMSQSPDFWKFINSMISFQKFFQTTSYWKNRNTCLKTLKESRSLLMKDRSSSKNLSKRIQRSTKRTKIFHNCLRRRQWLNECLIQTF